jgi:hypothetical protein
MENLIEFLTITTKKTQALVKRLKAFQALKAKEGLNLPVLEKNLAVIKGFLTDFPDTAVKDSVLSWYMEEASALNKAKDEFRFNFGATLKGLLEKEGIALHGQLPMLRAGFFSLKINFDLGSAALYWGPEIETIKTRIPLTPEEIVKAIKIFLTRLGRKEFDTAGFLKKLHRAYQRSIAANNLSLGTKVFLVDVLPELAFLSQPDAFRLDPAKERFREYSRIQFGFDLYRLKQGEVQIVEHHKLKLSVATFDATTEKKRSLWVPDNDHGEGTYYSYIAFEPVNQN